MLIVFSVPLLIMATIPELYLIILFSIVAGSISWYITGRLTPVLTKLYIIIYKKLRSRFKGLRQISLIENKKYTSKSYWDIFYRALVNSFFPTIISFTVIGYLLRDTGTVNNPQVFLILIFSPVIVSFIIPLRILQESKLYYVDNLNKEIISVGREANVRLKSIGGLLALGLFLFTLYSVTGDLNELANNLIVFFSFIYPTITITSYLYYDRWHREFIELTNWEGKVTRIPDYIVGLFREDSFP
ncbi:MAG: hypothetical protein ACOC85_03575 [Thermoplasmatota archaeon]